MCFLGDFFSRIPRAPHGRLHDARQDRPRALAHRLLHHHRDPRLRGHRLFHLRLGRAPEVERRQAEGQGERRRVDFFFS